MKKYYFIIFMIVIILGYNILFYAERRSSGYVSFQTHSYMRGIRLENIKDGEKNWELSAKRAVFKENETIAELDTVQMNFIKEGMNVSADKGIYNMERKDLKLIENIQARMKNFTIKTKSLDWIEATKSIIINDNVLMEGKKYRIEGKALQANLDGKMRLSNNVKAIFYQ